MSEQEEDLKEIIKTMKVLIEQMSEINQRLMENSKNMERLLKLYTAGLEMVTRQGGKTAVAA